MLMDGQRAVELVWCMLVIYRLRSHPFRYLHLLLANCRVVVCFVILDEQEEEV